MGLSPEGIKSYGGVRPVCPRAYVHPMHMLLAQNCRKCCCYQRSSFAETAEKVKRSNKLQRLIPIGLRSESLRSTEPQKMLTLKGALCKHGAKIEFSDRRSTEPQKMLTLKVALCKHGAKTEFTDCATHISLVLMAPPLTPGIAIPR